MAVTTKRKKQKKEKEKPIEVEYQIGGRRKKIQVLKLGFEEEYIRKMQTLQLIAVICVMIIIAIFPLQFAYYAIKPSNEIFSISIGFIVAGVVPSIIAIFGIVRGRKLALNGSLLIFGVWILVQSIYFWEVIIFISVLIIYYEITQKIITVTAMVGEIKSTGEEGAYYHASIFLQEYLRFIAKFSGLLIGISLIIGIIGQYLFTRIQGDILFAVFMIVTLVLIVIITRETITADLKAILLREEKERREELLAKTHSKYS
ncbi:MAG: hypothetical protein K9W42_03285 [Candidatus Heimdallarchaeota archaeon]|nr:hypothetical protein [Candidatus Heimdallarchaeota archaeon]